MSNSNNPDLEKSRREALFDVSRKADNAAECDQARNANLSVYLRLCEEKGALEKAKRSADNSKNSTAYHVAQSKLDLVEELLQIDGLEVGG